MKRTKIGLAAVAGVAAGYGIFRCLQSLDRGVRREIAAPLFPDGHQGDPEERDPEAESMPAEAPAEGETVEGGVAERILTAVRARPGVRQAELYALFPEESRRNLQGLLLRLTREAVVSREREGNTYRLYVAGAGH